MKPIRVLLVDDHAIFRQGTAHALSLMGGVEIAGEADNGLDAVERARTLRPDVILMDLKLPGLSGLEATRRIVQQMPESRVVVLTFRDDESGMIEAMRAGARGYLLKSVSPEELWAHVRSAAAGEIPISGSLTMRLISALEQRKLLDETPGAAVLTDRERALVELVAQGQSNPEIARALFMSVSTVKLHLRQIMQKLNLSSRAELISLAARGGILRSR